MSMSTVTAPAAHVSCNDDQKTAGHQAVREPLEISPPQISSEEERGTEVQGQDGKVKNQNEKTKRLEPIAHLGRVFLVRSKMVEQDHQRQPGQQQVEEAKDEFGLCRAIRQQPKLEIPFR